MKPQEILVVDDDRSLLEMVKAALGQERFAVCTAASVPEAVERLLQSPRPAAMILDISLEPSDPEGRLGETNRPLPPGATHGAVPLGGSNRASSSRGGRAAVPDDGLELLRWLRRQTDLPVIMLSGTDAESIKVLALELGADDYVTKPVGGRELAARIRAVLRRAAPETEAVLRFRLPGGTGSTLEIDSPRHAVLIDGEPVRLTHAEFGVLTTLAQARGRVLTRVQLLDAAFGAGRWIAERTIDVHVRRLRQKLESDPGTPEIILTVRGAGYRFGLVLDSSTQGKSSISTDRRVG